MTINISVIIPTFNRIDHLSKCIISVLKQTYPVDEIILVDNGSNDKTVDYIRKNFNNVKVFIERKRGVSFARNFGILNSKNNWIAFLDSDDEWLENKIEEQVKVIIKSNYKAEIIHTNEKWIRNARTQNQKKKHKKKGGKIFKDCLEICKISPSSVLIKKKLFDKYGSFNTTFKVCEDYELWLRLTSKIKVYYVNEVMLIKHGGHSDQLSKKYWGIDRYRIKALENLILNTKLINKYKILALGVLLKKINIVILGSINKNNKRIFKMYSYKRFF